jgi:hypothetical protein
MRAGSDVNTQQVIELVQRTIGFAVQDATEIAAGLASCKELIIPNLIDSAAIASAHAASNAGVQCDLNPKSNGICSKQSGPRKKAGGGVVRPNRRYSVNGSMCLAPLERSRPGEGGDEAGGTLGASSR